MRFNRLPPNIIHRVLLSMSFQYDVSQSKRVSGILHCPNNIDCLQLFYQSTHVVVEAVGRPQLYCMQPLETWNAVREFWSPKRCRSTNFWTKASESRPRSCTARYSKVDPKASPRQRPLLHQVLVVFLCQVQANDFDTLLAHFVITPKLSGKKCFIA